METTFVIQKTKSKEYPLYVRLFLNGIYSGYARACRNNREAAKYINSIK